MTQRLDYMKASPAAVEAMCELEKHLARCHRELATLDHSLLELVKLRASQLNGCAFCIDMHTKEARAAGETEQRLYGVSAWRDMPFYTEQERAALAWTEVNTHIPAEGISDALYDEVKRHFSDTAMVDLTLAIIAVNGWNRIVKSFKPAAGHYEVGSLTF